MHTIPRRQALRQLGLITAGLAAACTPLRVLVSAYPQAFDDDGGLMDRVLRAFVTAVIPGAPADDPDLVRAHTDPAYPFAQYAGFFAADLSRRAARRFDGRAFERLALPERTAVIAEGLAADATTRKLYNGAVVLAQIAFYAGIYDPKKGCPAIGFEGGNHWHPLSDITHPDPERFLSQARTADGNYV
ncbi:MAG: hypothetical protein DMD44_04540 [Gemmatimonadetes bacterium]|nr:MAG: hypothetical protein DMD44_04540 [Gemmatimonadota bacterium]